MISARPEVTLIARVTVGEIRWRTSEMSVVSSTHQSADPNVTPRTSATAGCQPEPTCTPSPAKTARNDRIVGGLLSVSPSVEA